ncbi:MAG TPA: right-handed parallel beta-helix repeat-containing protein [Rudaea sp.]|nr:right-handed parallel beta-helix repeat-containing protein [Rudaea sp.]
MWRYLVAPALVVFACISDANAVCVSPTSSPSLYDKLVQWRSGDNTTITIDLEQGTYPISINFDQRGPGENTCCDSYGHNANLVMRGGYKPGTGCDPTQRSKDAGLTILDGGGAGGQFYLWINGAATVTGLTFENFQNVNGVTFFGLTGGSPTLQVDHVLGIANETMLFQASTTTVQDVLVTAQPPSAQAALNIVATDQYATATHLTIVANGGYGLSIANQFGGNIPASIFNSIFYNNTAGDIVGYDASDNNNVRVYSSIAVISGNSNDFTYIPPGQVVNVLATDPVLQNYRPYALSPGMSPAINLGTTAVVGGEPSTDIEGNPRIAGGAPDAGAYESSVTFYHTYEVTSAADNGDNASPSPNSLRAAIASAKADAAGQLVPKTYRIAFNLPAPSGCPPLLIMSTGNPHPFPDIDFDLTVDATTQPGWAANTTFHGFDAVLCVGLNGGDVIPTAFHTIVNGIHAGRLSLFGMKLGGFTDAAVKLEGGNGHLIHGNQIGNVGVGILGSHAANNDGVRITGTTGASFVGAFDDPSTRNMITNNTSAGVRIDSFIDSKAAGSYIVNNLIGLGSDGATPVANGGGIAINGTPRNVIEYNTIAASTAAGLTISGANAQFNVVQYNMIGVPETGSTVVANGTQGVVVNLGAANNTIGAQRNSTMGGNTIAATGQDVYISTTGGVGNLVKANELAFTSALPIDLGAPGITPNDALDGDSGPNHLQNFPVILHAYRTKTAEWIEGTLNSFAGDAFGLDFYFNSCCSGPYAYDLYLGHDSTGITDASGNVHFWARLPPIDSATPLAAIVAAVSSASGDTSEMSAAASESGDMVFRDDFQLH